MRELNTRSVLIYNAGGFPLRQALYFNRNAIHLLQYEHAIFVFWWVQFRKIENKTFNDTMGANCDPGLVEGDRVLRSERRVCGCENADVDRTGNSHPTSQLRSEKTRHAVSFQQVAQSRSVLCAVITQDRGSALGGGDPRNVQYRAVKLRNPSAGCLTNETLWMRVNSRAVSRGESSAISDQKSSGATLSGSVSRPSKRSRSTMAVRLG